jgi:uncharacterized phage protein (TIGR01671 family)
MREILFRAKTDNKWVYGVPVYLRKEAYIVRDFCLGGSYTDDWVEAETIGQYIGICDKNGNKIFEHDIVKVTEKYSQQDESPFIMIGEIVYEDCMFGLKTKDGKFYTPIWENEELEVIGNSFDNKDWSENNDNR